MSVLDKIRLPWRRGGDSAGADSRGDSAGESSPSREAADEVTSTPVAGIAHTVQVEAADAKPPEPASEAETAADPGDETDAAAERVGAMIEGWREELVELASRGPAHTFIELSAAHPTGVAQLYAGRPTRLSVLVREQGALAHALVRARDVLGAQAHMIEAHGIGPVYLAIGTVSWTEGSHADNLRTGAAGEVAPGTPAMPTRVSGPALLCPVKLEPDDDDVIIRREPMVALWGPLETALTKRGAGEDLEAVLSATAGAHGFTTTRALAELREVGQRRLVSFDLYDSLTIGQYQHPVREALTALDEARPGLVHSPMLRAIAGVEGATDAIVQTPPEPQPADRDPRVEHGVGDLDPLQHDALDAVAAGGHLFLTTPAGTASAPTVLAILVDQILAGRSVTYVAGTTRHARALAEEAERWGLSEMVADYTSGDWQRRVTRRVLNALSREEVAPADDEIAHNRAALTRVRSDLGGYMDRLHVRMAPWGVSAYDCLQVLTDLTTGESIPRTRVRFDIETLTRIAHDGATRARELIQATDRLGIMREAASKNAWHRVVLASPDDVEPAVAAVREMSAAALPRVTADIERTVRETGLTRAETLGQWEDQLHMLEGVGAVLDVFEPEIFEASAGDMVIATATKAWREDRSIHMRASQRRRLVKQARDYVRPGRTVEDLHAELIAVQKQRTIWRRYAPGGGFPTLPEGLQRMREGARRLRRDLERLEKLLGPSYAGLTRWPLAEIARRLTALADDDDAIAMLPERVGTIHEIHELGLDALIEDLRERGVGPEHAVAELDLAWWASALSQILRSDRRLQTFNGDKLEELVNDLRALDLAQVNSLATQALRRFREHSAQRVARRRDEATKLRQAIESGSVAGLLHAVGGSALGRALVPLQIVPPALASQLAQTGVQVDLVILEGVEASPLGELAVPLGRASQVIVVGEKRAAGDDLISLASSLLPALTLPVGSNRMNGVVASFLADHGYGAQIVPIAQPSHPAGLEYVLVDGRGMPAPGANPVESTSQEVAKVVDLVIAHALERPEDSLAVIACNDRHAQRLSEAVLSAVADSPAIDAFFRTDNDEPFVVSSLSRCQGISRERVILTLGYGKTPHGRVIHDFGEIASDNGAAYLAHALLATRGDLTIVTALDPDETDMRRIATEGTHMMHDLLHRAKYDPKDRSPLEIARRLDEEEGAPDRLLVDLAERLYSLGLTVVPNVGPEDGLRIPLAIGHPDLPEELLVAVMTDNATYVGEPSLRRRDRHWADRLREYGWVTHMVFSTAVFMDPQGEAERILEKVLAVVEERTTPAPVAAPVPERVREGDFGLPDPVQGPSRRPPRPNIARGLPLAAYSDDQLDDLLAWIRADGTERSEAEEVGQLIAELGLTRRGEQIEAILTHVVRRGH